MHNLVTFVLVHTIFSISNGSICNNGAGKVPKMAKQIFYYKNYHFPS
jgi:hypothetical protein